MHEPSTPSVRVNLGFDAWVYSQHAAEDAIRRGATPTEAVAASEFVWQQRLRWLLQRVVPAQSAHLIDLVVLPCLRFHPANRITVSELLGLPVFRAHPLPAHECRPPAVPVWRSLGFTRASETALSPDTPTPASRAPICLCCACVRCPSAPASTATCVRLRPLPQGPAATAAAATVTAAVAHTQSVASASMSAASFSPTVSVVSSSNDGGGSEVRI